MTHLVMRNIDNIVEELKNELGQLDEDSLFAAKMLQKYVDLSQKSFVDKQQNYADMTNEYRNGWQKEEVRMEKR